MACSSKTAVGQYRLNLGVRGTSRTYMRYLCPLGFQIILGSFSVLITNNINSMQFLHNNAFPCPMGNRRVNCSEIWDSGAALNISGILLTM